MFCGIMDYIKRHDTAKMQLKKNDNHVSSPHYYREVVCSSKDFKIDVAALGDGNLRNMESHIRASTRSGPNADTAKPFEGNEYIIIIVIGQDLKEIHFLKEIHIRMKMTL